jgi:hypothetical protein
MSRCSSPCLIVRSHRWADCRGGSRLNAAAKGGRGRSRRLECSPRSRPDMANNSSGAVGQAWAPSPACELWCWWSTCSGWSRRWGGGDHAWSTMARRRRRWGCAAPTCSGSPAQPHQPQDGGLLRPRPPARSSWTARCHPHCPAGLAVQRDGHHLVGWDMCWPCTASQMAWPPRPQ